MRLPARGRWRAGWWQAWLHGGLCRPGAGVASACGGREGLGLSKRGSLPRLAGPSQPSVPVQSVSEEKTQACHLHVKHQNGPPSHVGDFIQKLSLPTSLPAL